MIKVMLADDDAEVLTMLSHLIDWGAHGFAVVGSADAPQDLLALPETPDVLITDIGMPDMDGYALAEAMKKRNPALRVVLLTCHDDFAHMRQAIHIKADDYLLKHTLTEEQLVRALAKIRQQLAPEYSRLPGEEEAAANQDVADVIHYVETHLEENITLEAIAAKIYKNSSHLSRLFKRITGQTFSEYLIHQRVERATRLLLETNLSIAEICKRIGIENSNYFYRFYERETGFKPSLLRKQKRNRGKP